MSRPGHPSPTPLLKVLLGVAAFVTAVSLLGAHVEIANGILEPLVTTTLVAAVGTTRIFAR